MDSRPERLAVQAADYFLCASLPLASAASAVSSDRTAAITAE